MDSKTQRNIAISLFNHTWTLIDKTDRSASEQDEMINAAHASLYHWSIAGTTLHQARGHWQVSRMYTVLQRGEPALYHAKRCLQLCEDNVYRDWDIAFAHEAVARAQAAAGNLDAARESAQTAHALCEQIAKEGDRKHVLSELATLPLEQ